MRPGGRNPFKTPKRRGKLTLTKVEVAVRQLETAIGLWANDGDFVSICTLSYAAHEIIYQINKGHKTPFKSFADPGPEIIAADLVDTWKAAFKLNYNFSKHGGQNAKELHRYAPDTLPYIIVDAICMYNHLGFPRSPLLDAYRYWFLITQPDMFGETLSNLGLKRSLVKEMVQGGKKTFLRHHVRLASTPDPV